MTEKTAIRFYNPKDAYGKLSNFYKSSLKIDGVVFSSVEQYFQAMKFYVPSSPPHMEYYTIIASSDSPQKVKMLGSQRQQFGYASKWTVNKLSDSRTVNDVIAKYKFLRIREDWDDVRVDIMMTGLRAKFGSSGSLRALLLGTQQAELVENSPRDSFWGIGKDGQGENRLGKLLMELRSELQ
jgi:predicted NAD-dependent protein-ADP-ribosyltransferase YbiA (DUF1768 family)